MPRIIALSILLGISMLLSGTVSASEGTERSESILSPKVDKDKGRIRPAAPTSVSAAGPIAIGVAGGYASRAGGLIGAEFDVFWAHIKLHGASPAGTGRFQVSNRTYGYLVGRPYDHLWPNLALQFGGSNRRLVRFGSRSYYRYDSTPQALKVHDLRLGIDAQLEFLSSVTDGTSQGNLALYVGGLYGLEVLPELEDPGHAGGVDFGLIFGIPISDFMYFKGWSGLELRSFGPDDPLVDEAGGFPQLYFDSAAAVGAIFMAGPMPVEISLRYSSRWDLLMRQLERPDAFTFDLTLLVAWRPSEE